MIKIQKLLVCILALEAMVGNRANVI